MVATLFQLAVTNAAIAAVLAVAVWLLARWIRRPQWTYGLWLIVLLKLVTPPLHSVPIDLGLYPSPPMVAAEKTERSLGPNFANPATLDANTTIESLADRELADELTGSQQPAQVASTELAESDIALTLDEPATQIAAAPPTTEPSSTQSNSSAESAVAAPALSLDLNLESLLAPIAAIWLAGVISLLVLVIHRSYRFARLLSKAERGPTWLATEGSDLCRRLGLSRSPDLRVVETRISPLLWAVPGRACVVLPADLVRSAPRSQVVMLLAHELAHYRRGDQYCRWFELFVLTLFWWNPVAWWARRQLHRAEEECCDAWVLSALPERSREYAGAILETLDYLSGVQPVMPAFASGLGAADILERRLKMILHGSLPRRFSLPSQLAMLLVAGIVLPLSAKAQDAPSTGSSENAPATTVVEVGPGAAADVAPAAAPVAVTAAPPATPAPPTISVAPAITTAPRAGAPVGIPGAPGAPLAPPVPSPDVAPGATPARIPNAASDQSMEARMDRLEKLVHDLAAAVGHPDRKPATLYAAPSNFASPQTRWALTTRPGSVADMKKRRVDLEVQMDAMREQLDRLQEEMQKLDDAIAEGNKKAEERPGRGGLQAK